MSTTIFSPLRGGIPRFRRFCIHLDSAIRIDRILRAVQGRVEGKKTAQQGQPSPLKGEYMADESSSSWLSS
jgi:hypothetical protein